LLNPETEEKELILKCETISRRQAFPETLNVTLPEVPGITKYN
jgi:hypothetical protein